MNIIQKFIHKIDTTQRKHRFSAFIYGVIKKYGEDEAGYQAALLTYYGFLALFPLLLVLTTVVGSIAGSHSALQAKIIHSTTAYFPMLGNQLSDHVHSLHRSGLALLIGIVLTMYGARGVADVFRHGVNSIWRVPRKKRDTFPKSLFKSMGIIIFGGLGFSSASLIASYTSAVSGHSIAFQAFSVGVNLFILFWLFLLLLKLSLPGHVSIKETRSGAASAAIGLVILQSFGSYLLARELKNLDALYSYFAIALGLLFWIYLQAQMLYYSIEIAAVRAHNLWPRSLSGTNLTEADKRSASTLYTDATT